MRSRLLVALETQFIQGPHNVDAIEIIANRPAILADTRFFVAASASFRNRQVV
jgi:hypothetical protein